MKTPSKSFHSGTSVVITRTPTEITVGADSKSAKLIENDILDIGTICKIHQIGNMFFSSAGFNGMNDEIGLSEIVQKCHQNGGKILSTVEEFEQEIVPILKDAAKLVSEIHPKYFNEEVLKGYLLSISFMGFEGGVPLIYTRHFKVSISLDNQIDIEIEKKNCPGDCQESGSIIVLGESAGIYKALGYNSKFFVENQTIPAIIKLIEIAIKDKPNFVGQPIDILSIDANGGHWVQKKKEC